MAADRWVARAAAGRGWTQRLVHGVSRTVPVILGAGLGAYAWAMLAALGVAGVVAASPAAFTAMKVPGAVVLLVLGVQAWRHSFRHDEEIAGSAKVFPAAGGTSVPAR